MNKYLKLFLCFAIPIITGVIVFFVVMKSGILTGGENSKPSDSESSVISMSADGLVYTSRIDTWSPKSGKVKYDGESIDLNLKNLDVWVYDDTFIRLKVPMNTMWKYLFTQEVREQSGLAKVQMFNGVTKENMSKMVGIKDGETVTSNIIVSDDKASKSKKIAYYVEEVGSALCIEVYDTGLFSTLKYTAINNMIETIKYPKISLSDGTIMDSIVSPATYANSVNYSSISSLTEEYLFADGDMYIQSLPIKYNDVIDRYLMILSAISGQSGFEYYKGDVFYAKFGSHHLGIMQYNSNTSIVMYGQGEEACCNIISILNN